MAAETGASSADAAVQQASVGHAATGLVPPAAEHRAAGWRRVAGWLHHHGMVHSPVDPADGAQAEMADGAGHGFEVPERPRTEELERQLSKELRPHRVVPRWIGWGMIVGGVLMLPWVAGLAVVLPERQEAAHYSTAWVGFDLGLCALLLRTGWLAQRGREHIELTAAMTGTLLVVDAWFDVVTANSRNDVLLAAALAVFAELPMAAFCLWIAGRVEYRRQQRARVMGRILRALRHRSRGHRRPPAASPDGRGADPVAPASVPDER
jgi:hypothetical protein